MRLPLLETFSALFLVSQSYAATSFTYNNETFLLDGEPYQIIGGQMDPQRIPYQYWEDRLYKARAMGLNTIFSYVFWDQIQPTPDTWDTTGRNDIAEYFRIAQEVGLNIVLRAGPYVCGEHEWGGFPAWLSEVPGMVVRSYNQPFLDAAQKYIDRLASELEPLMVTNGGPVIMVQIENEYGSYGADHTYMAALRDMFKSAFGITLYTNDGGYESDLIGGAISGVLAETDGSPQSAFAARDEYVTDPSSLGPQLDGEYYITWLDFWASNYTYGTDVGSASAIETIQGDLSWVLANGSSFSLYMFHGGTNWDFQSGADWGTALEPVITSYDYGAPLDESGRTTDIYNALRQTISSFLGNSSTLPSVPQNTAAVEILDFEVSPTVALFDVLPEPVTAVYPIHMEALNQSHGFVLYRHTIESPINGTLQPGDFPRDRVLVYVNAKRVGVIDSSYETPNVVNLALKQNDVLDLLIENMGRINYGPRIPDQRKGVVGNVTISGTVFSNWAMYSISLDEPTTSSVTTSSLNVTTTSESGPIFYSAIFDVTTVGDTFLELPNWTKGVVWVNGINLGRYWIVGPQQTLYLPGCYLKEVGNQITVLALEPSENETIVRGVMTRNWGNFPDPDAPPN